MYKHVIWYRLALLWDKFFVTLDTIKKTVLDAELVVLTFDCWSAVHNDTVFVYLVSYLDDNLTSHNQ